MRFGSSLTHGAWHGPVLKVVHIRNWSGCIHSIGVVLLLNLRDLVRLSVEVHRLNGSSGRSFLGHIRLLLVLFLGFRFRNMLMGSIELVHVSINIYGLEFL